MDPAFYDDPETFDIRRYADGRRTPPQRHLTFGFGPHVCLGAYLARLEMQEAFKLLPKRWPNLRLDADDPQPTEWNNPYGVHGLTRLALQWDAAA
jgi:cytochrome P450